MCTYMQCTHAHVQTNTYTQTIKYLKVSCNNLLHSGHDYVSQQSSECPQVVPNQKSLQHYFMKELSLHFSTLFCNNDTCTVFRLLALTIKYYVFNYLP